MQRNAFFFKHVQHDINIVNETRAAQRNGSVAAKASGSLRAAFGAFRAISFSDQGSIRAKFKRAFPPVVLQI